MRYLALILAAFLLFPAAARAQHNNMPVFQTGLISRGHAACWTVNGVAQDCGGAASGTMTELGITNTGAPFCINDALISNPGGYHQFCLGANALGGGLISFNAYGGAAPLPCTFALNGNPYPCIPTGNGNILGPTASSVGNVVEYNNATGTLVKDAGAPPTLTVPTNAALKGLAPGVASFAILTGGGSLLVGGSSLLTATTVAAGTTAYREGFYAAGDGGSATYVFSPGSCTVNSGAGDNGSQVAPLSGSGCWIAQPSSPISFDQFGAHRNSATDSSAAITAAFAAYPGGNFTCGGAYYTVSATVRIASNTKTSLSGCGGRSVFPNTTGPGFYAGASNLNPMFDMFSSGNTWTDTYINLQFNGVTNTSGVGIIWERVGGSGWNTLKNAEIDYACNVISINGIVNTVDGLTANQQGGGSACFGVEIGPLTQAATNETVLANVSVHTNPSNRGACNFAYFDASGTRTTHGAATGGAMGGTCVIPGANQADNTIRIINTDLGDALGTGPSIWVNPSAPSGTVKGLYLTNDWASSSQGPSADVAGYGLLVQNTNGGVVDGVYAVQLTAINNHGYGVYVDGVASGAPPTNILVADSTICGNEFDPFNSNGAGVYVNDAATVPPSNVSILGNRIGATCNGQNSTSQPYGIFVAAGVANNLQIHDNNLTGNSTLPMPVNQLITGVASISNNVGIDDNFPTLTPSSGAIVNMGPYPEIALAGSSTLTTLDAGWSWRVLKILSNGVSTITGGSGNICSSAGTITTAADKVYPFQYNGGGGQNCWMPD